MTLTGIVYHFSRFKNLEDALLGEGRSKDYGEIGKRSQAVANGIFVVANSLVALVFDKIPFIYHHNKTLVVLLYYLENVEVLTFYSTCGIEHEDADIRIFNGPDGAHYGIEFKVFGDFVFASDAGCVDEVKIETEFVETCKDAVARGTSDVCYDVAVYSKESIYYAAFSGIGAAYYGETGYAEGVIVGIVVSAEFLNDEV